MASFNNAINANDPGIQTLLSSGVFVGSTVTQYGTLVADASNQVVSVSPGTAGQVLTSNGASADPSYQNAVVGVTTVDGDTGSATGSALTIFSNQAALNSGSSVTFDNTGATSTLSLTDGSLNTIIGNGSGVLSNSASSCTGLGAQVLASITDDDNHVAIGRGALQNANDGTSNTAVGAYALNAMVSAGDNTAIGAHAGINLPNGNFNTMLGYFSGTNYTTTESSNLIFGSPGQAGDNNTIRIGDQGSGNLQQNQCFIAGVAGISVSNLNMVTIDTTSGQLGSQSLPTPITGITLNIQTFTVSGTYSPTAGMIYCIVEVVGGGGGGATATAVNPTASGGGGGEYAKGVFSAASIGASKSITIGAGGTAGVAGTATSLGVLISANGGGAGVANNTQVATGGAGGTGGTGGSVRINGTAGGFGSAPSGIALFMSGAGGIAGGYSGYTQPVIVAAIGSARNGLSGVSYGGGGGAGTSTGGTSGTGGTGSNGVIIITEVIA